MYHASSAFTQDQKDVLRCKVLKDDRSDEGQVVLKASELILPSEELKAKLWA